MALLLSAHHFGTHSDGSWPCALQSCLLIRVVEVQVLFFVRLFADMSGRTLPRKKTLALTSQRLLFALSCVVAITVPFFFLYLKSPPGFHSDWLAIGDNFQDSALLCRPDYARSMFPAHIDCRKVSLTAFPTDFSIFFCSLCRFCMGVPGVH